MKSFFKKSLRPLGNRGTSTSLWAEGVYVVACIRRLNIKCFYVPKGFTLRCLTFLFWYMYVRGWERRDSCRPLVALRRLVNQVHTYFNVGMWPPECTTFAFPLLMIEDSTSTWLVSCMRKLHEAGGDPSDSDACPGNGMVTFGIRCVVSDGLSKVFLTVA
jgi:hypothetical protein